MDKSILERAARALIGAEDHRPYGGYDYGYNEAFYGPAPEAGRYVIRADFAHSGYKHDEIVHQTNDETEHEDRYAVLTHEYRVRAVLQAIREPSDVMLDRFVSRALCVSISGEGSWSAYGKNQWQAMIDAALEEG